MDITMWVKIETGRENILKTNTHLKALIIQPIIKNKMFKNPYQKYKSYFKYSLVFIFEIFLPFLIIQNIILKEPKIFNHINIYLAKRNLNNNFAVFLP